MIKFENVNKYFDQHKALKSLSFELPEHETTVIVGPSGSGKSTLLRSFNLLEQPEEGLYSLDDKVIDFAQPISEKTILEVRRQTGMVFQDYNLFPHLTVLKNVMEGPLHVLKEQKLIAAQHAEELLELVGLSDRANYYPNQLSGGQQQRVAIARAMAMNPKYLLFDEPTSALDPELEAEVLKVLLKLDVEKNSMVIVTHNMAFAKAVASNIIFLEEGNILFNGSPDEFFNHPTERIQKFLSAMTFEDILPK
ncbi:amino acid ABC transporter ATP-binding protein [Dellaglioa algida]|uniref:amino acid ABC transporter ATP-binding protein n=1 Tax=Dellaglioa algida TaxID=105612 RepID=UPI0024C4E3B7|nr:amino acid ABC transporter ATP-binding protein [Dellaglioa algida]MDK1726981.1 amino acid ABC transporter ATP-binding protein [Dellaglioa algida]